VRLSQRRAARSGKATAQRVDFIGQNIIGRALARSFEIDSAGATKIDFRKRFVDAVMINPDDRRLVLTRDDCAAPVERRCLCTAPTYSHDPIAFSLNIKTFHDLSG
jgi:hypothetical protein